MHIEILFNYFLAGIEGVIVSTQVIQGIRVKSIISLSLTVIH